MNKMNTFQYAVALIVLASNVGCSFGFVATDLAPSVPPLEDWRKKGATPEQRLQDSIECGGGNSVYVQFTPQALKDERRPDESELVASHRLFLKWRDCMLNKGYYTGSISSPEAPDKVEDSSRQVLNKALKPEPAASIKQEPVTSRSNAALGPRDSRILLRSTGMPMNVDYYVSTGEQSCKDFTKIGTVRDRGEKMLSSWIVKLGERLNSVSDQIETVVPGGHSVQVAGWGNWYDSKSKGNCGPVVLSFEPEAGRTYLVEFVWQGTARCMSRVQDVTDPTSHLPVVKVPTICSRSFMDIWLGRSGL